MILIWFRRDLRLQDNPSVAAALAEDAPILPVYIHDESMETRPMGAASRWWLHQSLHVLDEELRAVGSRLIIQSGHAPVVLMSLCKSFPIKALHFSRTFDPVCDDGDREIAHHLSSQGVKVRNFKGHLLGMPGAIQTRDGKPFRIFTPYMKAVEKEGLLTPNLPGNITTLWPEPDSWPQSQSVTELGLLPPTTPSGKDWTTGFRRFTPGEPGARKALRQFLRSHDYASLRDRPDLDMTSHLSPHLRFGEISPHRLLTEIKRAGWPNADIAKLSDELVWRDFSYNLLHQQPRLHAVNFRRDFDGFSWRDNEGAFNAWRRGETGYDMVDAGMKELWQTGYMHNRMRMICASFLVKHLLIDWRRGEQWFWDCLIDADPASNPANWQWVAGCGADAAPYFRIFNPITQAAKFDPGGLYRARYLGGNIDIYIKADKAGQPNADPFRKPVVDHAGARQRALDAYHNREPFHDAD